jgi:hypothetical protein
MSNLDRMAPDLRVGDRERAAAAERLSAHHAAGRLSVDELERRLERAGAAVFAHDLYAVEADLPPVAAAVPRAWSWLPVAAALVALGVAASVAAGHPVAPLFLVAIFLLWRRSACT